MTDKNSPPAEPRTLVIVGGGGGTGALAVDAALAHGADVRVIDHSLPENRIDGVRYHQADVLSDDLTPFMEGADAVVSCLGVGNDPATLLSPPPLYTDGTAAICDAMTAAGVARLIVISASFVEAKDRGPVYFILPAMTALARVFEQMARMEENLQARSDIDWTAVRPGWLMAGPASGDYTVTPNVIPDDMIRTRRADLAEFMVDLAMSGEWSRRTPAIARHEDASASSPKAVLDEITG
ncbi:NAD(P)H-binding protein [Sulfitobacter albidus]|uniref:NAD(P)H-binding protein n=1 Tax=Sulfitobacter albidus TaxID=2829501 RepID=A0A975JFG3_9RHOB|nr:NAD(P)H-binding protein [Sulfitobacter albidus]QUJ77025.1 NAD(P)H-binding protein [Sulfitobacter albidus]